MTRRVPERPLTSLRNHLLAVALAVLALATVGPADAAASKGQWSIFEDPAELTNDPARRAVVLQEIKDLGADTIRITLRWDGVAPAINSKRKPSGFNSANPNAYPGFGPYDDLINRSQAMGLRVIVSITGHAPRWARVGKSGLKGGRPALSEFRNFVRAVATRYSGKPAGHPKVDVFAIWHEPNQGGWLAPQSRCKRRRCKLVAPSYYRQMVRVAYPVIKSINRDSFVLIGQLAPSGSRWRGTTRAIRPLEFLRAFGCRTARMRAIRRGPCRRFRPAIGDGFGHHPYSTYARYASPYVRSPSRNDAAIGDTKRFIRVLDSLTKRRAIRVGGGGRFGVYFTEFGVQTNPPDPYVGTSLTKQAAFINQSEEFAYRNSRIKSYSQYLLYDEPKLKGSASKRWSSFQTGLRLPNRRSKPGYNAYKLPLVVKRRGRRVAIWGRVRPDLGPRFVQLQQRTRRGFRNSGGLVATNPDGYFSVRRNRGTYRFEGFVRSGTTMTSLGRSRVAKPSR